MRVNRAPRAAPSGRPAALRGRGRLPDHRLRHQHEGGSARRSRGAPPAAGPLPGDRIRCAKDTGLNRFPLQGFAANRVWCLIVALACDLLAFSQLLAMADAPRPRLGAPNDPPAADDHPRPVDTRNSSPARHDPEGRTLWPLERPDHRETTRGKPSHPTGIIPATTPATTPPTPHSTRPRKIEASVACC